jgi:hypothetical protein
VHIDAEGIFRARPSVHNPNSSPSHIVVEASRFLRPSTCEHSFVFLESVSLAFEGMNAKGGRLDLAIIGSVMTVMIKIGPGNCNGH